MKKNCFEASDLKLSEEYQFDVVVKDTTHSFKGKLSLSNQKILLTIMGETSKNRNFSSYSDNLDELVCKDANKDFILYNLKMQRSEMSRIFPNPEPVGFFEVSYHAEYLIYSPCGFSSTKQLSYFTLDFTELSSWLGRTNTQENILQKYHYNEPLFDDMSYANEFNINLDDSSTLGIEYKVRVGGINDYHTGMSYPPKLLYHFNRSVTPREIFSTYNKLSNLIGFFIGNDIKPKKITFGPVSSHNTNIGSLYFPCEKVYPKRDTGYTFYPLGHDLKYDTLGLPSLSLEAFNKYFSLTDHEISYWSKYSKYKRMENAEERFLGYFRLLEKLCHKSKHYLEPSLLEVLISRSENFLVKKFGDKKSVKSFLKGIPRYNNSKYNTAKCIQDFYQSLPEIVKNSLRYDKKDIPSICKHRNDITHANDYYLSERELHSNAKFIEIILVIALLDKLDIDRSSTERVISRINGYHLATKSNWA